MRRTVSFTLLSLLLVFHHAAQAEEKRPDEVKNGYKSSDLAPYLQATEWTIFSLDPVLPGMECDPFAEPAPPPGEEPKPKPDPKPVPKPAPEQLFHDYLILGQTTTAVTPNLKTAITTLDEAGRGWGGGVAACFSPRHGIRVVARDGTVHDIILCYECFKAYLYQAEKHIGTLHFATDSHLAPRPAFLNGALMRAKVKMPPSAGR